MAPCNCGKTKRAREAAAAAKATAAAAAADKKAPVKTTGATQRFVLITSDSRTQTFGSLLEAQAARVRAGGVGTVRPM